MGSLLRGLDPRLRRLADKLQPLVHAEPVAALVLAHSKLDETLLKTAGATHIARLTEHIWSIRIDPQRLADLQAIPNLVYIEAAAPLFPLLTRSVPGIRASPQDIGAGVDGRNVVIGIIDYGIDWTLPDFCDETGTRTRIKYLWDQSLTPRTGESSPADFAHGVEYGEQQINHALQAWRGGAQPQATGIVRHRPLPDRNEEATDTDGHGTHVTGIACGNGASFSAECFECRRAPASPGFVGVAPNAWIIFVHLNRRGILGHVGKSACSLGNSADLAEAIAYCYRKADALGDQLGQRVPCVVNLSMGFNGGSHDGESLVERVIDTMLEGKGRALVVAAGNERQQRTFYTGAVPPRGSGKVAWHMGIGSDADITLNEMEIWYPSTQAVNVRLISPQDERSELVEPGERKSTDFGPIAAVIDSERFTPLNGGARIYLQISPAEGRPLSGEWTVELYSTGSDTVDFDAWIEKEAGVGFRSDDPRQSKFDGQHLPAERRVTSLTVPATARRAITVGAVGRLSTGRPNLYARSGTGPTRDGRLKPDLVAPGIDICSNAVQFGRHVCTQVQNTGTSMAAPHVSGVVALMFQLNGELTSDQVKQILVSSAENRSGRTGFDPQWGFGVLNASGALRLVRQTL
jgi:subtilisin family serine protease